MVRAQATSAFFEQERCGANALSFIALIDQHFALGKNIGSWHCKLAPNVYVHIQPCLV